MVSRKANIITGLIGLATVGIFTIGLAHSISTGFAGFKGGLPFTIIVTIVLLMALYDFYDSAIRKNKTDSDHPSDRPAQ